MRYRKSQNHTSASLLKVNFQYIDAVGMALVTDIMPVKQNTSFWVHDVLLDTVVVCQRRCGSERNPKHILVINSTI